MARPVSPPQAAAKNPWWQRPAQVLSRLLVVFTTLTLLALLLPGVPYLAALGTLLGPFLLPHLFGLALAGLVLTSAVWYRQRTRRWLALLGLAAGTVAGLAGIVARQVGLARSVGVSVSLTQAIGAVVPGKAQPDTTLTYATAAGEPLVLSIFRPAGRPVAAPVLLRVHGGGWISGGRLIDAAAMRWFAEQGWVVVSVDYTLSSAQQHLWQTTEKQIACAMAWTAQHIAAYGGDITHLALTGDSAGGNLALNCAYQANAGTLTSGCGGVVPPVQAVALLYPVVSPASFYDNPDPVLGIPARRMAGAYLGGSPREVSAGYQAVASATYIRPTAPPTLLLVGSQDHLVPQQPTIEFAELARRAGIPTRLVVYPFGDHAFDGFFNSLGDQTYRQLFQHWFVEKGLFRSTSGQGAKTD